MEQSFETLSQEGVFLPKDLRVGSEWDTTYAVEGKFTTPAMGNQPVNMKQSIAMQQKALAEESVTVPAGTFTAIKIEQKTTVTIDFGANAIMQQFASQMPPITTTNYLWLVKGVGMVKSESVYQGETSRVEAISINR